MKYNIKKYQWNQNKNQDEVVHQLFVHQVPKLSLRKKKDALRKLR